MMHGFQQIVTQAERRDNFVVHGLPPLGDAMGVSPLIWRKKLMDSISGNLGYTRCAWADRTARGDNGSASKSSTSRTHVPCQQRGSRPRLPHPLRYPVSAL